MGGQTRTCRLHVSWLPSQDPRKWDRKIFSKIGQDKGGRRRCPNIAEFLDTLLIHFSSHKLWCFHVLNLCVYVKTDTR